MVPTFYIVSSSNGIGIHGTHALKQLRSQYNIHNLSISGASAMVGDKNCFINQIMGQNYNDPSSIFIIFIGINRFENDEYQLYRESMQECISILKYNGLQNHQLKFLSALPRGSKMSLHRKQMKVMRDMVAAMEANGFTAVSLYDELRGPCKHTSSLFGTEDLRKNEYKHYSKSTRNTIGRTMAKIIIETGKQAKTNECHIQDIIYPSYQSKYKLHRGIRTHTISYDYFVPIPPYNHPTYQF